MQSFVWIVRYLFGLHNFHLVRTLIARLLKMCVRATRRYFIGVSLIHCGCFSFSILHKRNVHLRCLTLRYLLYFGRICISSHFTLLVQSALVIAYYLFLHLTSFYGLFFFTLFLYLSALHCCFHYSYHTSWVCLPNNKPMLFTHLQSACRIRSYTTWDMMVKRNHMQSIRNFSVLCCADVRKSFSLFHPHSLSLSFSFYRSSSLLFSALFSAVLQMNRGWIAAHIGFFLFFFSSFILHYIVVSDFDR